MGRDDGRDRGWADIVGPLDEAPASPPAPPPEAPPGPALDFSAQELVSALDASPAAPTEAPGDPRNRRAIWTVALGLAAVVGAVVVTASTREPPPAPKARPDPRGGVPLPAPPRAPPEEAPRPGASQPVLTVLSTPSGAEVEVGGQVLGKTPLVTAAPGEGGPLEVSVALGRRRWRGQVAPGEGGHYRVRVSLPP